MYNLYAELIHSDCARSRFAVASRAFKSLLIPHMSRLAVLTSLTVWFYLKKKKMYTFYANNLRSHISHTSLHKWSGRPMHKSGGKISFCVNQVEWNRFSLFSLSTFVPQEDKKKKSFELHTLKYVCLWWRRSLKYVVGDKGGFQGSSAYFI